MQNFFDQFDATPAKKGPILGPAPIPKAPDPYQVQKDERSAANDAERLRLAQEAAAREQARFASEQAERDQKAAVTGGAKAKTAETLRNNLATIDRIIQDADDNGGWGETGASGAFMRALPVSGTAGYSLESELATLKANNAFTGLIALADQGIKLSPISNEEVKLAAASIANLDPNADHETFLRTLRGLQDKYRQTLAGLEGPSESDPQTAAQMTQWASGVVAPAGGAPTGPEAPNAPAESVLALAGGEREARDDTTLEPGQQWAYDGDGNRIGILNPDGSWNSGFGSIVDDVTAREAEDRIKTALDGEKIAMAPGIEKGASWNWSDEYRGLQGGLQSLVTEGDFGKGYTERRDLERAAQRLSREEHGILPEIGGSLATAFVPLGTAATATKMMGQGAAIGAIAGAGEGEGLRDTAIKTAIGTGVGGATGGVISQVPKVARALTRNRPAPNREVIEAAQRQEIPIRAGDINPQGLAHKRAVARTSEEGNQIIKNAEAEDLAAAEAATLRLGEGNAAGDRFEAGERAQAVLTRQGKRTKDEAQRLYRIGEEVSDGVRFAPKEAVATLNDEITRLEGEGADAALVSYLRRQEGLLRRPEGWTPMQLHAFRSNLRKNIRTAGLPVDAAELPMIRAVEAAGRDLQKSLVDKPAALSAIKRADEIWSDRAQFRREVGDRLFGKDRSFSPDQTGSALDSLVRSDSKRFARFMKEMEPEEAADLRATYAAKMGRDAQGNFSMAKFLAQSEGKGALATPRSMRLLFGEDGMRAITDLRAVFNAKQAAASETNYSRTGNVVSAAGRGLRSLLFAGIGAGTGGTAGAVVGPLASGWLSRLGERRAARLVTNPDFARWLRQAPDSDSPTVVDRYLSKLNTIASRDQAFLMDANAIRSFVADQFSKGTGRAAADEKARDDRRK